jgi:multiple sugar transport system substrate-binding protein
MGNLHQSLLDITLPMLYSAGTSVFSADGMSLEITKQAGIDAIQKFADLVNKHHVAAPSGTFPSATSALINDQLAMFTEGSWARGGFVTGEGADATLYDVGIAQIPTQSGRASNMVWGAGETLTRTATKEAFEYFKYRWDSLRTIEEAEDLARISNVSSAFIIPLTKNVLNDPVLAARFARISDPYYSTLVSGIADRASRIGENITVKNFSQIINEYIQPAIELVVTGDATAAEAFKNLNAQTRGLLQGVY